jgi:hypothetical protein
VGEKKPLDSEELKQFLPEADVLVSELASSLNQRLELGGFSGNKGLVSSGFDTLVGHDDGT